jgi:hypothetical protein
LKTYYLYCSRGSGVEVLPGGAILVRNHRTYSVSPKPCYDPFNEKPKRGFKRTLGKKSFLYYVNGRKEVFLSDVYSLTDIFPAYFAKGVLRDLWNDKPLGFKKVFYHEWPFMV